jgi:hypothetical protein
LIKSDSIGAIATDDRRRVEEEAEKRKRNVKKKKKKKKEIKWSRKEKVKRTEYTTFLKRAKKKHEKKQGKERQHPTAS